MNSSRSTAGSTLARTLAALEEDGPSMADEFTAEEWAAIDAGAVRAYMKRHAQLPGWLQGGGSGRGLDPASEVRGIAYLWALKTPHEVHDRAAEPWKIRWQVTLRVGEIVDRIAAKTSPEDPWVSMDEQGTVTEAERLRGVSSDGGGKLDPKRFPPRYWSVRSPHETPQALAILDGTGMLPSPDLWQFTVKRRERTGPVWATAAELARLHQRPASPTEYWTEIFDGNGRRSARVDLEKDTDLAAETVAGIASKVAPRVQVRFRSEYPRATDPNPVRQRIALEESRAVLNEDYAVWLDDDWNSAE